MSPITRGQALGAAASAYVLWGFLPPFLASLKPAGPLEILSHRIVWSFALVLLILLGLRSGWGWLRSSVFTRRAFPVLLAAAALIGTNWLVYIWAVANDHVVEASLGYFINPLVNVLFGVLMFGERPSRGARVGGAIVLLGVVVISAGSWQGLWVSLTLACSFGLYGVVKKRSQLTALQGLLVESGLLLPLAVPYLLWLGGDGQFGRAWAGSAMLVLAGGITALPLWFFAVAAPRLQFGVLGVLQYVSPTIQFLLGITVFGEHVTPVYWMGLVGVWVGSVIYLTMTIRAHQPPEALEPT
ncbi:MAG: EamA family transporter RarD [Micropruina sp.]|uniref:EamA family transporter RarD n=1 Tax=Micropruina sp. TaxID=2737536 RepID=UPI0039E355B5